MLWELLAWIFIVPGILMKSAALFSLFKLRKTDLAKGKRIYNRLNWPGDGLILIGIVILIRLYYY